MTENPQNPSEEPYDPAEDPDADPDELQSRQIARQPNQAEGADGPDDEG